MRNYYKVLGISETASQDEIKEAYRKLAKTWHPDRNPNDPMLQEMMKLYNEAYDVLSDPIKRYDHDRSLGLHPASGREESKDGRNEFRGRMFFRYFEKSSTHINPNKLARFADVVWLLGNIVLAVFLLLYGTIGVFKGALFLPERFGPGTYIHGKPVILLYAAILCIVLNRLSDILEYYDRDRPKINYRLFRRISLAAACVIFLAAIVLDGIINVFAELR